ncbi:Sgo1p NDAI_0F00460 [Naumovozyma dairenensis CBS 421]|uniref:Shugoshin C-terminal domain-containing protein n=1 Tax=Naumovozyma dairenensis (strain ATCC 10597 / BCRC 20456 / CBS 421 / NBRC 0211 / NRRL Y-12639) TaxID=1071378 RepID=G0WC54_NAUDC|nr:hypothetical protein NDAI_0F00460 [Naumovozyma dairenensis CBS 421]CCD25365.1 hypothetical protein NDAI_0F00460 [Naumovozyma dairenensis CBS 421]
MAKSLRKCKKTNYLNQNTSTSTSSKTNIPQIQQFQNLTDQEYSKLATLRSSYSQQNNQLAKENSTLKLKINEMEKKLSQLIQENVILRSNSSQLESQYKQQLNDQLQILEDGVIQRFEEILYIFDNIRKKENLLPSSRISRYTNDNTATTNTDDALSTFRSSLSERKRDRNSSITFGLPDTNYNNDDLSRINNDSQRQERQQQQQEQHENDKDVTTKRRRKSSRRQSMFVPSDFSFPSDEINDTDDINTNTTITATVNDENEDIPTSTKNLQDENFENEEEQIKTLSDPVSVTTDISTHYTNSNENTINTHEDTSNIGNYSSSIMDYSIPEESFQRSRTVGTVHKTEVFRDTSNDSINDNVNDIATDGINVNNSGILQIDSQHKIKHSMKPPKIKNKNKIIDEVMPTSTHDSSHDLDFIRPRRTRGKTIDYKLPSLRAKMRRPTEKLVDATTVTNFHDLQVTRKLKRDTSPCNNNTNSKNSSGIDIKNSTRFEIHTNNDKQEKHPSILSESPQILSPIDDENVSVQQSLNKVNISPKKDKIALSDITAKVNIKSSPGTTTSSLSSSSNLKRKLYKKAIDNDIDLYDPKCNTTTTKNKDKTGSSKRLHKKNSINCSQDGNKSVSFRLNEEDLSVFDLIGSDGTKKHTSRTYRTKQTRK